MKQPDISNCITRRVDKTTQITRNTVQNLYSMDSHNLGKLRELPGEIRAKIWRELRPSKGTSSGWTTEQRTESLGILRAGRQLNEEIIPYLYDNETLYIEVLSEWSEWLTINNSTGTTWRIPNTRHPYRDALSKLPFKKLSAIEITINAPDQGNTAQFLTLFKHTRELAALLEQAEGLPQFTIRLCDTESGQWSQDGKPQKTISMGCFTPIFEPDYRPVLLQFARLRSIQKVTVQIANRFPVLDRDVSWLENMIDVLNRKEPFGSFKTEEDDPWWDKAFQESSCYLCLYDETFDEYWDDEVIQRRLNNLYYEYESVLDVLPGQTADMMRLERFMYWYNSTGESEYVNNWEGICSCKEDDCIKLSDLNDRHDFLVTFNPLSSGMQRLRLQMNLPPSQRLYRHELALRWNLPECIEYIGAVESFENNCGGYLGSEVEFMNLGLKSCWYTEEWRKYYPHGIPPLTWTDTNTAMLDLQYEVGENNRHEEGLSPAETPPSGYDRIRAQTKLIDFNDTQSRNMKVILIDAWYGSDDSR